MDSQAYAECDGLELAARIRGGELTAEDAIEHAYRLIERVDPQVNAFVSLEPELAQATAARPTTGPFAGVPMAMKDCVGFVAGAPRRFGSRRVAEPMRTEHTHEVMRRFQAAGRVPNGTLSFLPAA